MNNYFSEFISRFGGEALGLTYGAEEEPPKVPRIKYITLYNPSWASETSESVEALSKQILFFANAEPLDGSGNTAEDGADQALVLKEQLNVVGLLRGSCSLVSDFGPADQPITIYVSGAAIVVMEIVGGYFLALSLSTNTDDQRRRAACSEQLRNMVYFAHRRFTLTHSNFGRLRDLHGDRRFCEVLRQHWSAFMGSFNAASDIPFGPQSLQWPNRTNRTGFFSYLPPGSHRKSTLKCADAARDIKELVRSFGVPVDGVVVANLKRDVPKRHGILLQESLGPHELCPQALTDLYGWLDEMNYNHELRADVLCSEREQQNVYRRLRETWKQKLQEMENEGSELPDNLDGEEAPSTSFSVSPAATLAMLHPVALTNTLVVSPLTGTVNGFRYLGSAVSEQLVDAPAWFSKWRGAPASSSSVESEEEVERGGYVVGLADDEITRLLVHIPTRSGGHHFEGVGAFGSVEYSVVAYCVDEILVMLVMDSGLEELEKKDFYAQLESQVLLPVVDAVADSINGRALGNSMGSLPEPINHALRGQNRAGLDEIDSDFFFMIYNTRDGSYQSSLPELPAFHEPQELVSREKASLHRVLFHLHDHLIDHFILQDHGRMFTKDHTVHEYLHKFSSNKSNDWLLYSMRHQEKVILIIRNYNHHSKKAPVVSEGCLAQVADSVYGAANLGFLDNLGGDVRVWLGNLTRAQE